MFSFMEIFQARMLYKISHFVLSLKNKATYSTDVGFVNFIVLKVVEKTWTCDFTSIVGINFDHTHKGIAEWSNCIPFSSA